MARGERRHRARQICAGCDREGARGARGAAHESLVDLDGALAAPALDLRLTARLALGGARARAAQHRERCARHHLAARVRVARHR